MSHTPGPWDFDDNRPGFVTAKGGPDICEVFGESARADECDSNHALIAAAPELLMACRMLVALEDGDVHDADTSWKQARKIMRAAIAKAEGRPE